MARLLILASLAATLVLTGCSLSPRYDRQFGSSVQQVLAQQTLNPQAGANRSPVNGMDGKAAESVYENYQKSFRAPEAQTSSLGSVGTR
jgi:outer membrane murein-binding lipoprotein Lpp